VNVKRAGVNRNGVTVKLDGTSKGTTNSSGNITMSNVLYGSHTIAIDTGTYWKAFSQSYTISSTSTINIALTALYTAGFNVSDSNGPISGAKITLTGIATGTLTTNSDGAASKTGIVAGTLSYSVSAAGYTTKTGTVTLSGSNDSINTSITLQKAAKLVQITTPLGDNATYKIDKSYSYFDIMVLNSGGGGGGGNTIANGGAGGSAGVDGRSQIPTDKGDLIYKIFGSPKGVPNKITDDGGNTGTDYSIGLIYYPADRSFLDWKLQYGFGGFGSGSYGETSDLGGQGGAGGYALAGSICIGGGGGGGGFVSKYSQIPRGGKGASGGNTNNFKGGEGGQIVGFIGQDIVGYGGGGGAGESSNGNNAGKTDSINGGLPIDLSTFFKNFGFSKGGKGGKGGASLESTGKAQGGVALITTAGQDFQYGFGGYGGISGAKEEFSGAGGQGIVMLRFWG